LKESYNIAKKGLNKFIFGDKFDEYNYVGETSFFINFMFMQIFRMVSFLVLFVIYCTYTFIYLRSAFYQYMFWGLTFTFLAFGFLFIGSGK